MQTPLFNRRSLAMAALATAFAAQAADQTSKPDGLMTFPHTYVIAQPPTAQSGAAQQATAPQGVKAFKDPVTGELTAPTADQAAALDAAAAAATAAAPAKLKQKALKSAPATFALPQGGVGMQLDDSQMTYSVAHKDASGKIVEQCLPNKSAAMSALNPKRKATKRAASRQEEK